MRLEKILIFTALLLVLNAEVSYGQDGAQQPDSVGTAADIQPDSTHAAITPDSTRATVGATFAPDSLSADSTHVEDAAPLDISKNSGLYIVASDGNMQHGREKQFSYIHDTYWRAEPTDTELLQRPGPEPARF